MCIIVVCLLDTFLHMYVLYGIAHLQSKTLVASSRELLASHAQVYFEFSYTKILYFYTKTNRSFCNSLPCGYLGKITRVARKTLTSCSRLTRVYSLPCRRAVPYIYLLVLSGISILKAVRYFNLILRYHGITCS